MTIDGIKECPLNDTWSLCRADYFSEEICDAFLAGDPRSLDKRSIWVTGKLSDFLDGETPKGNHTLLRFLKACLEIGLKIFEAFPYASEIRLTDDTIQIIQIKDGKDESIWTAHKSRLKDIARNMSPNRIRFLVLTGE